MKNLFQISFLVILFLLNLHSSSFADAVTTTNKMEEEKNSIVSLLEQVRNTNDGDIVYELGAKIESFGSRNEYYNKFEEFRRLKTSLILETLKVIKKRKDPKFDINDGPAKNIPPEGPYLLGTPPEAIKEEDIRKKYEAAIAANNAKGKYFSYQVELLRLEETLILHFEIFTGYAYSRSPYRDEELKNYFEKYQVNEGLRKEIFESIKEQRGEIKTP